MYLYAYWHVHLQYLLSNTKRNTKTSMSLAEHAGMRDARLDELILGGVEDVRFDNINPVTV